MEKHKVRLNAELTRVRLKKGFASLEDLRRHVDAGEHWQERLEDKQPLNGEGRSATREIVYHPRWIRINTIKTTLREQMRTTFAGYTTVESLQDLCDKALSSSEHHIYVDKNIPDLVAVPKTIDLSKTASYLEGRIILQDKASCFPAHLLDPRAGEGDIVDACAAPGNKTTHLAALLCKQQDGHATKISACERDMTRANTLKQMLHKAGAGDLVTVHKQDFLKIQPQASPWNTVTNLLLDPSCSGSGIVGRDDVHRVVLPSQDAADSTQGSKKRKRKDTYLQRESQEESPVVGHHSREELPARLEALSSFQLKLLLHAFSFPAARRITYSTCSSYAEENELVVMKALGSTIAKERGWLILRRDDQVEGMKAWEIRGDQQACRAAATPLDNADEIAEACIRCERDSKEGTQGFFVAGLVRNTELQLDGLSGDQWEGFSTGGVEDDA